MAGWELSLVVSVYDRTAWNLGLPSNARAKAEKCFLADVPAAYDQQDLAIAMRQVMRMAHKWMDKVKPDLIDDVVLTVYSLEVK